MKQYLVKKDEEILTYIKDERKNLINIETNEFLKYHCVFMGREKIGGYYTDAENYGNILFDENELIEIDTLDDIKQPVLKKVNKHK